MANQLHTQKNTPATSQAQNTSFQPRPFAIQAKEDGTEEERTQSDFQVDIDRAEQFGHSLDRIQVQPSVPVQAKATTALPIQREADSDSDEDDMQPKMEGMPIQQSQQPVQFFLPMLLPMIMPMIQPMLQPILQQVIGGIFGGGGGGGAGGGGGGAA